MNKDAGCGPTPGGIELLSKNAGDYVDGLIAEMDRLRTMVRAADEAMCLCGAPDCESTYQHRDLVDALRVYKESKP